MNKTRIGLLLAAGLTSSLAVQADQPLKRSQVPKAVIEALQQKYPAAKTLGFQKEVENGKTQYEANLKNGAERVDVSFSPEGKVVSEETEIAAAAVPAAVKQGLAASRYSTWKVNKAERVITNEDRHHPSIELDVQSGRQRAEVAFDAAGKLVNEERQSPKAKASAEGEAGEGAHDLDAKGEDAD